MLHLIKTLILPPGCFLVLLIVGLGISRWRPRWSLRITGAATILLYAASTPLFGTLTLSWLIPGDSGTANQVNKAIVVLGGDFQATSQGDAPGKLTLQRLWRAAQLYRKTHLPVLVTAGEMPHLRRPGAETMARVLQRDFDTPVQWRESRATDTWENARYSAQLLKDQGIAHVFLVSNIWHLPRASYAFAKHGIITTAAPVFKPRPAEFDIRDLTPRIAGLQATYFALHEIFGRLWYRYRSL